MKTIWKYELKTTGEQTILIPEEHDMLTVQMQNGVPCLWAYVDTESKKIETRIDTFGTGNPIDPPNKSVNRYYIGTYQQGIFVFHVFVRYWN